MFNLGYGISYSVFEVLTEIENIVGGKLNQRVTSARRGDPVVLLASITKAREHFYWTPKANLSQIVMIVGKG